MQEDHDEWCPRLDPELKKVNRRSVLRLVGGALGAVVMGCRHVGPPPPPPPRRIASAPPKSIAARATPEGEIGPFFSDDSDVRYKRSDILTNIDGTSKQAGIPLTLTLAVFDAEKKNAPMPNCQIDIWHCNADGKYSNQSSEGTVAQTWLRGYQLTDEKGLATFQTLVPGWYHGRTTHIHLRVRSSYSQSSDPDDGINTTQLMFDQDLVNQLATTEALYKAEGVNDTTNASDHVFGEESKEQMVLKLTGDNAKGYMAKFDVYLPITGEYTSASIFQRLSGIPTTPGSAV